MSDWEAWLKVKEVPQDVVPLQAPPPIVFTGDGVRYRCGRCGRILIVAPFGEVKGFFVHCKGCDHDNEVTL